MKKTQKILIIAIAALLLNSCSNKDNPLVPDTGGNQNGSSASFLAYYKPGTDMVLGETPLVALLSYENNNMTYSAFLNAYPPNSMTDNADINNNILAMGLHKDFDDDGGVGVYLEMNADNAYYLPLVTPTGNNDYSYFQPTTADVTDNGYVVYSAATNDRSYGDEYVPFLMRFNVATGDTLIAVSPDAFALVQPEKGSDTEGAQFNRNLFASLDGKYAYGHIEAYGVEGGGIHWDYNILFRYDFENREYKRLGEPTDNDVNIIAMGSNRNWILYSNNGQRKILDLATNTVTYTDMHTINVKKNSWGPNGACVGASDGTLWYKDFVNNKEILVCQTNAYGWAYNAMFSKDGGRIYFMIEGSDNNYLCITENLTENCNYDTLGTVPSEFYDMIMVK